MRASVPTLIFPASGRRQIDVHVDVRDIQHREHLAAGRKHLADIGDSILNPAIARGDQIVVADVDRVEPDIVLDASSARSA